MITGVFSTESAKTFTFVFKTSVVCTRKIKRSILQSSFLNTGIKLILRFSK
jgi:hypothetical protein